MDKSTVFKMHAGGLLCLRTRSAPWLDALAAGLSQLAPCSQITSGPALWMRLGPDEWWCWLGNNGADVASQMQAIEQAAEGFHTCVDLSDGHASCVLPAPAGQLLSAGCDLDVERLVNFAGRTRLGPFTVVLSLQVDPADNMRLWVEASLAESLQLWLERTSERTRA